MKQLIAGLAVLAILFQGATLRAQTEYVVISDPLTNSQTVGELYDPVGSGVESSFNAEGWKPGHSSTNKNHILYSLPYTVKEGYYEYEIKGMQPYGASETDADFDPAFSAMYDGRGITEPIAYFDDYKQNFFRWNVHFRGDKKKIKSVINLSNETQARISASKSVFANDDDRDFVAEPTGSAFTWNPENWYKIRVHWKDKKYTVTVNDTKLWEVTGPYVYNPVAQRIWLGCAPGYEKKYTASIQNLVFRNFKLVSYSPPPALFIVYRNYQWHTNSLLTEGNVDMNTSVVRVIQLKNNSDQTVSGTLQATGDVDLSHTSFELAPNTSQGIEITFDTETPGEKQGTITIESEALPDDYVLGLKLTVLDPGTAVTGWVDDYSDNIVSPVYVKESTSPSFFDLTEQGGAMHIAVNKTDIAQGFSAIQLGDDANDLLWDLANNPRVSVRVKADKDFMLQIGPREKSKTENPNKEPNLNLPDGPKNIIGDGQWRTYYYDFADEFAASGTNAALIDRFILNFDPGFQITLTANVWFDNFKIGDQAESEEPEEPNAIVKADNTGQFRLFPNPASDMCTLALGREATGNVHITSLLGKMVYSNAFFGTSSLSLNISDFRQGIYFVTVETSEGTHTSKLLVR